MNPVNFTFLDESRYATLGLGPSFSGSSAEAKGGVEGLKQLVARVPQRPSVEWRDAQQVAALRVASRLNGTSDWTLAFEESITYPKCYRAVLTPAAGGEKFRLEVLENFAVLPGRMDLADMLPESLYGVMLGFAAGMTEVQTRLLEAHHRELTQTVSHEARPDWRAPRFSFSLRTATGSPFMERWAFAVQESTAAKPKLFRLWIEQQRIGREIYVFQRRDGTLEGERDVETLPAGVHGAAIGAVLGMKAVVERLGRAEESGELPTAEPAMPRKTSKDMMQESREEAEAILEEYMLTIRAKPKGDR